MWREVIGLISASTVIAIFFGLRWLEWSLLACGSWAAISILSLIVKAGIRSGNRPAVWIESHAPRLIRHMGTSMSETIPVRVVFWLTLFASGLSIGWLWHDSYEYHNTYVLTRAVVESQDGRYLVYHFEDDPAHYSYAMDFCPPPEYQPAFRQWQVIDEMTYTRKFHGDRECESISHPRLTLRLRRYRDGRPVLARLEEQYYGERR